MIIVKENFYEDPDSVREWALAQKFNVEGNYPGTRTASIHDLDYEWWENLKGSLERIVGKDIKYWPDGYNTAFQYTTKKAKTWAHHDLTEWAAVLYLTPNAPVEAGTGIYRHRDTGIYKWDGTDVQDYNETGSKEEEWILQDSVSNVYNRIVCYHGSYYHRSILPGFGTDKNNARLFQTFFFDT